MKQKKKLPSIGQRRLLKLADLLEADAKKEDGIKFNLNWFVLPRDTSAPVVDCSTHACAVGLACISGVFRKQGLGWKIGSNNRELIPTFREHEASDAAELFFAITSDEFDHLFMPHAYDVKTGATAEREVAQRIRDFVAGKAHP